VKRTRKSWLKKESPRSREGWKKCSLGIFRQCFTRLDGGDGVALAAASGAVAHDEDSVRLRAHGAGQSVANETETATALV